MVHKRTKQDQGMAASDLARTCIGPETITGTSYQHLEFLGLTPIERELHAEQHAPYKICRVRLGRDLAAF